MLITIAEIERIAALEDPVMRNLRITQAYSELSAEVARSIGEADVNWCGFATWASKQAGQTIRQEDLKRTFEDLVGGASEIAEAVRALRQRIDNEIVESGLDVVRELTISASFERASDAAASGNLLVFAEIAREFARFLLELGADDRFSRDRIREFGEALRPGPPPSGQEPLRRAFEALYRARFETDPKRKAELVLLCNLEVGFHEQTRLQPEIREALDAPVVDAREVRRLALERLLPPWSKPLSRLRHVYLRLTGPLDRSWGRLTEALREIARRVVTEVLMNIQLPHEVLCLGDSLERRPDRSLRELDRPELAELLAKLDPDPDSSWGSGADDWSTLTERMHFIAEFFRAYQHEPSLNDPPFTPAQLAAIRHGQLPSGRL